MPAKKSSPYSRGLSLPCQSSAILTHHSTQLLKQMPLTMQLLEYFHLACSSGLDGLGVRAGGGGRGS